MIAKPKAGRLEHLHDRRRDRDVGQPLLDHAAAAGGSTGTLLFRSKRSGGSEAVGSSSTTLSSLPATWTTGAELERPRTRVALRPPDRHDARRRRPRRRRRPVADAVADALADADAVPKPSPTPTPRRRRLPLRFRRPGGPAVSRIRRRAGIRTRITPAVGDAAERAGRGAAGRGGVGRRFEDAADHRKQRHPPEPRHRRAESRSTPATRRSATRGSRCIRAARARAAATASASARAAPPSPGTVLQNLDIVTVEQNPANDNAPGPRDDRHQGRPRRAATTATCASAPTACYIRGFAGAWKGPGTITNSYLFSQLVFPGDHVEAYLNGGEGNPSMLQHDTILNPFGQTAAISFFNDFGGIGQVTVQDNLHRRRRLRHVRRSQKRHRQHRRPDPRQRQPHRPRQPKQPRLLPRRRPTRPLGRIQQHPPRRPAATTGTTT